MGNVDGQTGASTKSRPRPEVVPKAKPRRFTAAYQQRIWPRPTGPKAPAVSECCCAAKACIRLR